MRNTPLPILIFLVSLMVCSSGILAQSIPAIHSKMTRGEGGLQVVFQDEIYPEVSGPPLLTLSQALGNPKGNKNGITFDFKAPGLSGTLYYGFIPYGDAKHPQPVFFKSTAGVTKGKTEVKIKGTLEGRYDMIDWEKKGYGTLGYRLVDADGLILYDGKVTFLYDGKFEVAPTIVEGPFVNHVTDKQATISFETNMPVAAMVSIGNEKVALMESKTTHHEFLFDDLEPATTYPYTVVLGKKGASIKKINSDSDSGEKLSLDLLDHKETYQLSTASLPGTRAPFTFAYASDSRAGQGGGEREIYGANAYIMKKIMALAMQQGVSFFQFSGDLINGYVTEPDEINLQYTNWKHAIESFAHYFPVYVSMGNHEALMRAFSAGGSGYPPFQVDRFPYETESAEAVFANNFVNPSNGPATEDGNALDPNPNKVDFPPYQENVFSYTWDNVGVIVLNSNYWYAPSTRTIPVMSGGMHGYIMDGQVEFLKQELEKFEANEHIDHVFLTQHTPFFPNGGHVKDDMWYGGDNNKRPFIAGKPVAKGIIERRDDLLNLIVNESSKVRAILTGDEHNYAKTEIGPNTPIYPDVYPESSKIKLTRTIYQINNGAAGAPYYAQEQTPWSNFVSGFTTQNALVLFDVEGKSLKARVVNPDTLEEIETYSLN